MSSENCGYLSQVSVLNDLLTLVFLIHSLICKLIVFVYDQACKNSFYPPE